MKVRLESTSRVVDIEVNGCVVPGRVWQGRTETGIELVAVITRIAAERSQDLSQFDAELRQQAPPNKHALAAFDHRLIL